MNWRMAIASVIIGGGVVLVAKQAIKPSSSAELQKLTAEMLELLNETIREALTDSK